MVEPSEESVAAVAEQPAEPAGPAVPMAEQEPEREPRAKRRGKERPAGAPDPTEAPEEPEGVDAPAPPAAAEAPAEGTAAVGDEPAAPEASEEEQLDAAAPGPGDKLDDEELVRGVSALLFASPEPLAVRRLVQLLEGPRAPRVRAALERLAERLDGAGLPLELREIAGGWRLMTAPEVAEYVQRLGRSNRVERLSAAGLETLSVIAYRQPVTKAEIEAIRGVQCGAMLRGLIDRGLVRVTGRASVPGNPLQYGTTKSFLDRFGLASLGDLPRDGELLGD